MKPINQSKGFSVCLNGWTIPKYALYGNVYNTIFVCLNTAPENGGYKILVWHNATEKKPGRWAQKNTRDGYGAIYVRIRDFLKSANYINEKPVFCHSRNRDELRTMGERANEARKRAKMRAARKWDHENMSDAPREKKAQSEYIFRSRPLGGSLDYEYKSGINLDGYRPEESTLGRVDFIRKPCFEQGQNTAGTAGRYTRSGFETRDGMKTRFADYHGQKPDLPIVTDPWKVCKDDVTGKYYRTYCGKRVEED